LVKKFSDITAKLPSNQIREALFPSVGTEKLRTKGKKQSQRRSEKDLAGAILALFLALIALASLRRVVLVILDVLTLRLIDNANPLASHVNLNLRIWLNIRGPGLCLLSECDHSPFNRAAKNADQRVHRNSRRPSCGLDHISYEASNIATNLPASARRFKHSGNI
jgi:hypothetical protein